MNSRIFILLVCVGLARSVWGNTNDGLVLYFPFDSSETVSVADQSGTGNSGEIHDARFTPSGCQGGAFEFNGTSSYIRVPSSSSLHITDQITLSAFFYAYDYNDQQPILNWVRVNPLKPGPQMWLHVHGYQWQGLGTGAHIIGADGSETVLSRVISFADPPPRQWHHMVITYNRATGKGELFLDGAMVKQQQMGSYEPLTSFDFIIGAGFLNVVGTPQPCFHGLIDEVRVYNRVVSPEEVVAMVRDSQLGKEIPGTQIANVGTAQSGVDSKEELTSRSSSAAGGGIVQSQKYNMTFIGFSSDPQGDEDVTQFYRNESLYVRVHDVDLERHGTNAGVRMLLYQENIPTLQFDLLAGTNGSFAGSTPLGQFQQGRIYVSVVGWNPRGVILRKDTELFINP